MPEKKWNGLFYLKRISSGVILTIAIIFCLSVYNNNVLPGEIFLYETIPYYNYNANNVISQIFKIIPDNAVMAYEAGDNIKSVDNYADGGTIDVFSDSSVLNNTKNSPDGSVVSDIAVENTGVNQIEDTIDLNNVGEVIGTDAVIYQSEAEYKDNETVLNSEILIPYSMNDLNDIDFLRSHFYIVDNNTQLTAKDFNVEKFLAANLKIDEASKKAGEPKVLIFHTHSTEGFADSDTKDMYDGIVGAGERLTQILKDKYGIVAIHHTERFDYIDGKSSIMGAYERMNPAIEKVLAQYPSIEVVIDMHRDGLPDGSDKLVTEINGKPTAKIMFFNGLSKLNEGGELKTLSSLPNVNLPDNLAFSFNMQLKANELYPGFTRKIYLKAYRYSLHFKPKSLLVEVGAQNNTKQEAFNAMEPLAEILADVILK